VAEISMQKEPAVESLDESKTLISGNLSQKELCLGVTLNKQLDWPVTVCKIFVGTAGNFRKPEPNMNLIALKRIPEIWHENLNKFNLSMYGNAIDGNVTLLGTIEYKQRQAKDKNIAFTYRYHPLHGFLGDSKPKGLPYFIEAITTHHLKTTGITHISTSDLANNLRWKQLQRVGLSTETRLEIDEWLRGMGRGIRYHINNKD
jgi:hypothetical protein